MGIRHIVPFKLKSGINWLDSRAKEAETATRRHPQRVPEMANRRCGRNTARHSLAHDFTLVGDFTRRHGVARHLVHPDHERGAEPRRANADRSVVDFEAALEEECVGAHAPRAVHKVAARRADSGHPSSTGTPAPPR